MLHGGKAAPSDCLTQTEHYVPAERTLYRFAAPAAEIEATVRWWQPLNMCVHLPEATGCDEQAIAFSQQK